MVQFRFWLMMLLLVLCLSLNSARQVCAASEKVLAVYSFERDHPHNVEIREAIEQVFAGVAEVTSVYLDMKQEPELGTRKAQDAAELFRTLRPDGVIAIDDDAMELFVLPFLKDRTAVPVTFCGVNAITDFHSATGSISGIYEHFYFDETLALARGLVGPVNRFAFMIKKGITERHVRDFLQRERNDLSVDLAGIYAPETVEEALGMIAGLDDNVDLLVLGPMEGLRDRSGQNLSEEQIIPQLQTAFGKATVGLTRGGIWHGALGGVIINLKEQGYWAARLLIAAMDGTDLTAADARKNLRGIRVINASTMKLMGVMPDPLLLRGVELVK